MSPASLSERLLPFLAVVLMLIVAAIHQFNVRAHDLAPDVGGGFGMFAFVDNSGWRTVLVTIEDADGRSWSFDLESHGPTLDLSPREVQRVRAMPSLEALTATAELVGSHAWFIDATGEGIIPEGEAPGTDPLDIARVAVTVYGVAYDVGTDEVRREVIANRVVTP